MTAYYNEMKGFADEMAVAGKPLEDDDLISYILTGLDQEYNGFIENVSARTDPVSPGYVYAQFLAAKARIDLLQVQYQSSTNSANRGRRGIRGRGGRTGGRGDFGGCAGGFRHGYRRRGEQGGPSGEKPFCQVCEKEGHAALYCWKRFDCNYTGEKKMVNNVAGTGYNVDTAWYTDTGATDHITGELDKLTMREKYSGQDQVHTARGTGMYITHIGDSTLTTPSRPLFLNHVLNVPSSKKNLVSIHRFTRDKNIYVEYHPYFFLLKHPATRSITLVGRCRGGMYPFPSLESLSSKCVMSTVKPSMS